MPAEFAGNIVLTGSKEIQSLTVERLEALDNQDLLEILNAGRLTVKRKKSVEKNQLDDWFLAFRIYILKK